MSAAPSISDPPLTRATPGELYSQGASIEGAPAAAWLVRHGYACPGEARWVRIGGEVDGVPVAGGLALPIRSPAGGNVGIWLRCFTAAGAPVDGIEQVLWDDSEPVPGAAVRLGGQPIPIAGSPAAVIAVAATVEEGLALVSAGRAAPPSSRRLIRQEREPVDWPGGRPVWVPPTGDLAGLQFEAPVRTVYVAASGTDALARASGISNAWRRRQSGPTGIAVPAALASTYLDGHVRALGRSRSAESQDNRPADLPTAEYVGGVHTARLPYRDED